MPGMGCLFQVVRQEDKFFTPKKKDKDKRAIVYLCIFLSKAAGIFAGKLGVQDYAVVYPPNGTPVSLGMNNLCPLNVKRSDRLNY